MEVSKDHLRRIVEDGEVEQRKQMKRKVGEDDAKNSGIILYTKPYDYLKEEDREEVIEFLVWLGLQTIPGTHRLQKEKVWRHDLFYFIIFFCSNIYAECLKTNQNNCQFPRYRWGKMCKNTCYP